MNTKGKIPFLIGVEVLQQRKGKTWAYGLLEKDLLLRSYHIKTSLKPRVLLHEKC